jgi:hypothetical protein
MTTELINKIKDLMLELDWQLDNDGQVVIYTGCVIVGNEVKAIEGRYDNA